MEANKAWEEQREVQLINIINKEGQLTVSSREVAENFDKEHKNVIQSIENLLLEMGGAENSASLFIEGEYQHPQNKQHYKEYLLTRDGFSLLVMGFTGAKALAWKLKYIDAFNNMEQQLKAPKELNSKEQLRLYLQTLDEQDKKIEGVEKKVDNLEQNMPLFNIECDELQSVVKKVGTKTLGGHGTPAYKNRSLSGKVYQDIQRQIKREFGIRSYKAIKRRELDVAISIVEQYKVPLVLKQEIDCLNNQIQI